MEVSIQPPDVHPDDQGVLRFTVHASGVPAPGLRSYALHVQFTGPDFALLHDEVNAGNAAPGAISCSGLLLTGPRREAIVSDTVFFLQSGQGRMALEADAGGGILCTANGVAGIDTGAYNCGVAGPTTGRAGAGALIDYLCHVHPDAPLDTLVNVGIELFPGLTGAILLDGPTDPILAGFVAGRLYAAPANTDVDGNGSAEALLDGRLILRYYLGLSGEALLGEGATDRAIAPDCTRCMASEVQAYVPIINADVDGNGSADALTDGLLILRYYLGMSDAALVEGAVASDCRRCEAFEVAAYMASLTP